MIRWTGGVAAAASLAWSIGSAQPVPTVQRVEFPTREGTWLSLDVSPDGRTILFELLGDLYALPSSGGDARPILTGSAFESQPRYSPDGTRIVFISDRGGADNVWVANADGSDPRPLSNERLATMFSPVWMPDGRAVVVSATDGAGVAELWRYDVDAGPPVRLGERSRAPRSLLVSSAYPGAYGAEPTADGRALYYTMVEPRQYRSTEGPRAWIVRLDLRSGREERVVVRSTNAFKPALSPGGATLVYATQLEGSTGLRVRDLATGDERWLAFPLQRDELEARASRDVLPNYAFTSDGSALVIGYGGKLHRLEIATGVAAVIPFVARVSLEVVPALDFPKPVEQGPVRARIAHRPTLAPDGRRVAFSAFATLYQVDLPNGNPRRVTSSPSPREFEPAWSPDGEWIAFVTWTSAGGQIWRARAAGSGPPEQLTSTAAFYTEIAWSPDGSRIVALRAPRQSRLLNGSVVPPDAELISIPSGGGSATRIVPAEGLNRPHFGPDPTRVFATTPGEGLISMRLDGSDRQTHLKVVASGGPFGATPADEIRLSPAGDRALALLGEQLYWFAMPAPGTSAPTIDVRSPNAPVVPLTVVGASDGGWSADGRTVAWSAGSTFYRRVAPSGITDTAAGISETPLVVERPRSTPRGSIVLRGATVLTMRGREVLRNADLVVTDNRIARIGPRAAAPVGARVLDLTGRYVIPGLIDVHAHWDQRFGILDTESYSAMASLAYGVTAVRDPQSFRPDIFAYGDLVEVGEMTGPRIFSTGPGIIAVDFRTVDEVKTTLRRYRDNYRTGLVKAYMIGNRLQRQWVVQESRELELMPTTEGGASLKMDLTHAIDGFSGNEHALPTAPIYDDVVQLFARSGITYTPTLLVAFGGPFASHYFFGREEVIADRKLRRFTPIDVLYPRAAARIAWYPEREYHFPAIATGAAAILRAGGRVALGGHGELQGLGTHWEMWALAMGGMRPEEVLQVATIMGAKAIGVAADLGTIEPGKLADLVVLDRNPLDDIRNTTAIRYVMKNGVLRSGETLDQVWPKAEAVPTPWWRAEEPVSSRPAPGTTQRRPSP